jgi:hypothetical protein
MQLPQVQGWPPFVKGHDQYPESRTPQVSNKARFGVALNSALNIPARNRLISKLRIARRNR